MNRGNNPQALQIEFQPKDEAELDWFRRQPSFENLVVVAARAVDHRQML
jgi:hypothetical protein